MNAPLPRTAAHARPDVLALMAVAVTVAVHLTLVLATGRPSPWFIGGACLFWTGYVIVRARQRPTILREWGFRRDNLARAALPAALVFVGTAACLAGYGAWAGTLRFPAHALPLFLVYPVWGVIQQFLALAIVVGNLERLSGLACRPGLVLLVGAVLFGAVHLYDVRLAAGTLVLELAAIPLYRACRNLWPLGVLHGWSGGLFYLWVLDCDLWMETFGEVGS
jgi:hypothetical protein